MSPAIPFMQRFLAVALAAVLVPAAAAVPPGRGAFGAAAVLPADASVAVRLRDARALRTSPTWQPAQAVLSRLALPRILTQSWDRLAGELGEEPSALVDRLIGDDVVYAERPRQDGIEWVIIARVEPALRDLLVERLKPAPGGGGRATFAAQQVTSAWRPPHLVLAPSDRSGLFEEVVARIDAEGTKGSLAELPEVAAGAAWDPAPVEVVLAHGAGIGGTSILSARASDGAIRIRHRGRFARPPLHVAPGGPADVGLLAELAPSSILALSMNPWRGELDDRELVDSFLLEGGIDDAMRANMGARQVLVVGESELDGMRVRVPTLAVAFELRDALLAEKQWDGWARRFSESVSRRAGIAPPAMAPAASGTARACDLGPAVRALFADHPFARPVRLSWATLQGTNGAWQVVASDAALLRRVSVAIGRARRVADPDDANEVGVLSGRALAAHLRTWVASASLFVPETPKPFADAVSVAADMAAAANVIRWRARAPLPGIIESELVVEVPPAAAEGGQAAPAR